MLLLDVVCLFAWLECSPWQCRSAVELKNRRESSCEAGKYSWSLVALATTYTASGRRRVWREFRKAALKCCPSALKKGSKQTGLWAGCPTSCCTLKNLKEPWEHVGRTQFSALVLMLQFQILDERFKCCRAQYKSTPKVSSFHKFRYITGTPSNGRKCKGKQSLAASRVKLLSEARNFCLTLLSGRWRSKLCVLLFQNWLG